MKNTNPWRVPALIFLWILIQWITCFFPVAVFRNNYLQCQTDQACRENHKATLWDGKRAYSAIFWAQWIQPMVSWALLFAITKHSNRRRHLWKAVAIGLVAVAVTSIVGLFIYDHYPRPQYWSMGDMLLEAYFVYPVFPILSAILGGIACGTVDWRMSVGRQTEVQSGQ